MTSFSVPPPALGGASLAGLQMPSPPPGLGSKLLGGAAAGSKAFGGAFLGGVAGAAAGSFMDLAFPQSVAVSDLSALPKDLYNSGIGKEIDSGTVGNEPILNGTPGNSYTLDVAYTLVNTNTGESTDNQRGSYVSYGPFGLALNVTGSGSQTLILFRSLTSGAITQTSIAFGNQFNNITNFRIVDIRTNSPEYQPPNDVEDNVGYKPASEPTKTRGGVINLPEGWTPPPSTWEPYEGATSGGGTLGDPISRPPGVGGGTLGGEGVASGEASTQTGTGGVASGGAAGGGGGGIVGGTLGGEGVAGGGGEIGSIPGAVGGDTTSSGSVTTSGGSTATGAGTQVGSPSETAVSSPTNTGQNTASTPDSIPINIPGIGTVGNVPINSGQPPQPGTLPFPPGTDIKPREPGEIDKNPDATKPATETPPPSDKEPEEKDKEPRIVPIPFNLNASNCCQETTQAVDDLAQDLECVIEKICKEDEPIVLEFLKIVVTKDPIPNKVMNPSTNGQYQDIVIAGYINWVVQGNSVGEQLAVRRREELFLIPEWAEGWEIYPCHQAEFQTSVIEVTQN